LTGNKNSISTSFFGCSSQVLLAILALLAAVRRLGATSTTMGPKGNFTRARMRPEQGKEAKLGRVCWCFVTSLDVSKKEKIGLVATA
jgi:hypothetical protein